ncbi:MAG: hypothetical protein KatS3mg105_2534 [Gemmatales bacterium]|nr:MAG: hypothetical protein KatS3mg105_2534 [Gemmatales bacterium]
MDALAFIESTPRSRLYPVYVLFGDEGFLKRMSLLELRRRVFGKEGDDFGLSYHEGDKTSYAEIIDEVATLPFMGSRRMVVVEAADRFVTNNRALLEKYVAEPCATGILVLEVRTWSAATKLAKAIPDAATIQCKTPPSYRLPEWCTLWATKRHGKRLTLPAARLLVELAGTDMGILDQEITKLAVYAAKASQIDVADVDLLVGRGQTANIFRILDALAARKPDEALDILGRLFDQGEDAIRILGALSAQLRKLAQVALLMKAGETFASAATQAGIPAFPQARQSCQNHLRHLGARVADLHSWLLELDLGLKGSNLLPPRTQLERFIARLA